MFCSVALETERELLYTYLEPAESLCALTDIIFPHYHAGCLESCVFSLFWTASWVELDIIPVDLLMDLWWFCLGMITRDAESDHDAVRMNNEISVCLCILSVNGHSYYFYNSAALLFFYHTITKMLLAKMKLVILSFTVHIISFWRLRDR